MADGVVVSDAHLRDFLENFSPVNQIIRGLELTEFVTNPREMGGVPRTDVDGSPRLVRSDKEKPLFS